MEKSPHLVRPKRPDSGDNLEFLRLSVGGGADRLGLPALQLLEELPRRPYLRRTDLPDD